MALLKTDAYFHVTQSRNRVANSELQNNIKYKTNFCTYPRGEKILSSCNDRSFAGWPLSRHHYIP